ncbi:hypothetical protein DFA_08128 [Cavenderia fasciculata]|uniref:Uncharacterized protein n=1 Tax=Cavenderia fasciculata TaxID=261658 RepID=F4Q587_CACFS|nr:uncharacterized protein DFA_08128 [Cavenderia fasciculata]EGG17146.1 hypothetical protein DFA_08128 [Cavenderia fasciculata]|eukprot:XP_004355630.1 hypothetical protein DFA_08128 [Cavenderia fasciculata]
MIDVTACGAVHSSWIHCYGPSLRKSSRKWLHSVKEDHIGQSMLNHAYQSHQTYKNCSRAVGGWLI